jgi:hypothetical protein
MTAKPFSFDDLPIIDGKRVEPEAWGPRYSKPPKASPAKPRGLDPWPTNCASGQKYDFDAAKHRAKLKAEFAAAAAADRRAWATGQAIAAAYERAMAAKKAAGKPHYVLRDGAWRLAA